MGRSGSGHRVLADGGHDSFRAFLDALMDFAVGGGIVYDSVPEDEYEETLDKGRAFFDVLESFKKEQSG